MDTKTDHSGKTCRVCAKVKSEDNFRLKKNGRLDTRCKDCEREYNRERKRKNPEIFKAERERNKDKYLAAKRRWDEKNKEKRRMLDRVYKKVRYALKTGKLVKGTECEFCKVTDKPLDGAHYDYSEPLKVKWLCKICHAKWDVNDPKTRGFQSE